MASGVHKNTDIKVETVSANSVCRQLPQKTAEQGLRSDWQLQLRLRRRFNGRWQYAERFRG